MFKITNNQKYVEGSFYRIEGRVLVGLIKDLEAQFQDDVSKLGYKVLEIDRNTLRGISNHSAYWIYLKKDPKHFKGIERLLEVGVKTGQEEEAIKQLQKIPYVVFAERMYRKRVPE